ncbi:unnamed protein product [Acanthoscelides obtectus]|uniref:MADF domain-containing protein n=1 Tax=Acanthoscelides obtectus TaxID=200917 RepID=A0A9P0LHK3_ACAOB|nr:unnamed protein product [Acanthoscelides obtectus]CAK1642016.1 hypothetical protein AOBTE_LOCUS12791 [Acanthoscelides obtectus]
MGFGFRSVEKWTMAVGRWKSKVKAKAAQLRIESQKTGGGCLNAAPLTDTEARLMKLIGWKSRSLLDATCSFVLETSCDLIWPVRRKEFVLRMISLKKLFYSGIMKLIVMRVMLTVRQKMKLLNLNTTRLLTFLKKTVMKGSIRPIAAHQPLPELKPFIEENTSNTATPDPQPSCSTVSKSPPTLRLLNQEPARKPIECKERWKNVRGRYTKYKNQSKLPSGSGAKHIKEYYLASHLRFLDSFVRSRPNKSNIKSTQEEARESEEENQDEDMDEKLDETESSGKDTPSTKMPPPLLERNEIKIIKYR